MSPADTRTAILDLAEQLVRGRSFNAFSFQDLADGVGIKKASVHYHFATKEDLGLALVARFREGIVAWANQLNGKGASPVDKLDAYFRIQTRILDTDGMICVFGSLGAELNALPDRLREAYIELLEQQQSWLTHILKRGQEVGFLAKDHTPEEQAALIQSALMGALQMARASGRPERFHAVVEQLRESVLAPSLQA